MAEHTELFQVITYNLKPVVRNEKMAGQDFLVVPMVMMVEGVLNGSRGPIYYPASEMRKLPVVWNNKPVVVYHPSSTKEFGSACVPAELTVRQIGVIMNTKYKDGKLHAEAWLYPSRLDSVDERVATAIKNQLMLELSTGLFVDVELKNGVFNNKAYVGIARNFRPDHLAVLPDLKGACSVDDGAGFIRLNQDASEVVGTENTELSHSDVRKALIGFIEEKGKEAWIESVWDDKFVYEKAGKLYEQEYQLKDNVPSLVGLPTEVIRVTTYEPVKNEEHKMKGHQMSNTKVDVKATVDAIIANESTPWTEEDREALMGLDEKVLNKMLPTEDEQKDKKAVENVTKGPVTEAVATKSTTVENTTKPQTLDEFINNAPAELRPVLRHGVSAYNTERDSLIKSLVANKRCTLSKEYLESKDVVELRALVELAGVENEQSDDTRFTRMPNFSGRAPTAVKNDEEPLAVPVLNFKKS
jgi:hypothetical protein